MSKKLKPDWPKPDWLEDAIPDMIYFHNEGIPVYSGTVNIEEIKLWRDNDRTLLDMAHIMGDKKVHDLSELKDDDIIDYLLKIGTHKISDLAKSILKDGVRQHLIITSGKELFDGNRRFLACKYLLKREKEHNDKFTKAPAYVLSPKISFDDQLKIIAETNFLPNYKLDWEPQVKADYVIKLFNEFSNKDGKAEAYKKIHQLLEWNRSDVDRVINVDLITKEYLAYVKKKAVKLVKDAEIFTREHFHFFEEFYNKALCGNWPIKDKEEIIYATGLFFNFILNQELESTTKIRNFVSAIKYEPSKKILKKGGSVDDAISIYLESALARKVTLKVERFCDWLENLEPEQQSEISRALKARLETATSKLKIGK